MKNYKKYILSLLAITTLFWSCSTEKNTILSRSYHNLTAHYNAYFNGRESLKDGVKKINNTYKDNYTTILPMFTYGDEAIAKSVFPEMDKAIKKGSKVIQMHSITAKPKRKNPSSSKRQREFMKKTNYCKWVDDSYLLIGKANFYKHEFYPAYESFEYVVSKFNNEPIKYDALLWLARNSNEQRKFDKTKEIIDLLDGDRKFPKRMRGELAEIYSDYFLKQKQYDDAIPQLRIAIDKEGKKRLKARYKYILAQIYQQYNDPGKASKLYAEVVKHNPSYEMSFNAQINRASCFESSTGGKGKGIKKELTKMLYDDKNKDYLDQIYYALGKISQKENNISEALKNYKLSAENSVSNNYQKSISYLAIADIYYAKPKYIEAQAYYDSTMQFLAKDYEGYAELKRKTDNLTELVTNLVCIQFEDSMQLLAGMSDKDRNKVIDDIIEKIKEKERKELEAQQQQQINSMLFNQNQNNTQNNQNANAGGKWYFYNPATLSVGMADFRRKWGTRKLEDNWRRKNKSVVITNDVIADEEGSETKDKDKKESDLKSRDYYLKDIPLTDSLMKASNEKIKDAYYNAARVYKDKFLDYPAAIKLFEELNKRYPDNTYLLTSYYNLYQLNLLTKNQSQADYYKNLIIEKYPESNYAKMLTNPDFANKAASDELMVNQLYEETYQEYLKGNFSKVFENYSKSETTFKNNKFKPNFRFLNAVSLGKSGNKLAMHTELKQIVTDYPQHEIKEMAQNILTHMVDLKVTDDKGNETTITQEDIKTDTEKEKEIQEMSIYKFDENAPHYYVVVVENKKVDVNQLKFDIVNFNTDFFSMIDFNVNSILLNDKYQIITIKTLNDKKQATTYFETINSQANIFSNIANTEYYQFLITVDNYTTFYTDKDINKYLNFYKKNY